MYFFLATLALSLQTLDGWTHISITNIKPKHNPRAKDGTFIFYLWHIPVNKATCTKALTAVSPQPVTVSRTSGTPCLGCGSRTGRTAAVNGSCRASRSTAMSLSKRGVPYKGCTVTLATGTIRPPESRRVLPTRSRMLFGNTLLEP